MFTYTSLRTVNFLSHIVSNGIHLIGSFSYEVSKKGEDISAVQVISLSHKLYTESLIWNTSRQVTFSGYALDVKLWTCLCQLGYRK